MDIRVYADLHQEHKIKSIFTIAELPDEKNQVLILAGDIFKIKSIFRNYDFFEDLSNRFHTVLYVFGNHEYYGYKMGKKYTKQVVDFLQDLSNLHILSRDTPLVEINNIQFIGATLWTNDKDVYTQRDKTNDFRKITYFDNGSYSRFNPNAWMKEFTKDYNWILNNIDSKKKTVIITHHAPSTLNKDVDDPNEIYKAFYKSSLDAFIENNKNIVLWAHGHIHNPDDFIVGNTRIFSNPIGYEKVVDDVPEKSLIHI